LKVGGDAVSGFEMECRVRVAEGGVSSLVFLGNAEGDNIRLALNANPGAQAKTGSIDVSNGKITTDLIPGGTWFDLRVITHRHPDHVDLEVYLNGVLFQELGLSPRVAATGLALELGDGASFEMSDARVRFAE
jgi:L-ascorbate metabolism protein UlaG (beta-lactamase superfamily)